MRGDFSRSTHRPNRHYSRVLLQQGRVLLDADWNEQVELQLQALRQALGDLIGPYGGPSSALAFKVRIAEPKEGKLVLELTNSVHVGDYEEEEVRAKVGRYYVDGIMVEHHASTIETGVDAQIAAYLFVYLEVWERHVTWVEENASFEDRSMREVALGGPDTASRTQVRWALRSELALPSPNEEGFDVERWADARIAELGRRRIALAAGLTTLDIGAGDPCRDTAQPRYRGPENRLYRVEIHEVTDEGPTFKWSRENGSVVFPIDLANAPVEFKEGVLTLALGLGRDSRYTLARGNIVELVSATIDEAGVAGPLLEVVRVDEDASSVELRTLAGAQALELPLGDWALLRRWDQPLDPKKEKGSPAKTLRGAIRIDGPDKFMLEDGIVVQFKLPGLAAVRPKAEALDGAAMAAAREEARREEKVAYAANYGNDEFEKFEKLSAGNLVECRPGDYWLIPARTIPADVEWPSETFEPPHGVARHYAPLALVQQFPQQGGYVTDLRRRFRGLAHR